jgi:hypothetical protein
LELEKKLLSSNFGFTQKAWEDQWLIVTRDTCDIYM